MALGFWRGPYSCPLFCVQSSENVSRMTVDRASWTYAGGQITERDVANTLASRRWLTRGWWTYMMDNYIWTGHSQAQSTPHASKALQVSPISSLLSKLCFQMAFMGLIVTLMNRLPRLWRPQKTYKRKMAGTFILFYGTCYFWCHVGGWTLHGKGKIHLWKPEMDIYPGLQELPCKPEQGGETQMYHVWDCLPSILDFYLMSPSGCSSGLLGTQRALHHSLRDVTFTLQT